MIESSVALSTLASAIAPPPPPAETVVRSATPDQASTSAERSSGSLATRYFRFNLKYDAVDQQLYFVFKNPITGAVVDEAPSVRSVRSPVSLRSSQHTEQVFSGAQSSGAAPASGGAPAASGSSAGSSGSKAGAPSAPGASAAPAAPGASSGGEQGRGSAIDSRI